MKIALLFERYSHVNEVCKNYDAYRRVDEYGGLIGHVIELRHTYYLVPTVGCMHTLNVAYCLHQRYNIDEFIRIGSCGVRNKDIKLGEYLLIRESVNQDALSERYFAEITPNANASFLRLFRKQLSIPEYNTYTVDVIWNIPDLESDTVDMETSALYSYANAHGLKSISISVARDNPSDKISVERWQRGICDITEKVINILEECD